MAVYLIENNSEYKIDPKTVTDICCSRKNILIAKGNAFPKTVQKTLTKLATKKLKEGIGYIDLGSSVIDTEDGVKNFLLGGFDLIDNLSWVYLSLSESRVSLILHFYVEGTFLSTEAGFNDNIDYIEYITGEFAPLTQTVLDKLGVSLEDINQNNIDYLIDENALFLIDYVINSN